MNHGYLLTSKGAIGSRLVLILLLSLTATLSSGQTGLADQSGRKVEASVGTLRVDSNLVQVPVTVTDKKGRLMGNLQKEHFALYEDGVEQTITHFSAEDAPLSISLVLDTSESMRNKMQKARDAMEVFLKNTHPDDEFSLIQFSDAAELIVPYTKKRDQIQHRLEQVRADGSTALLDAVLLAIRETKNAQHRRKVILLISDGEDNRSSASTSEVDEAVRQADALIYAIGIFDRPDSLSLRSDRGPVLLREMAEHTGGRLFNAPSLDRLRDITAKIGSALRAHYLLGYAPKNHDNNGQYRTVKVKLIPPNGSSRVTAFWRQGYYAPQR